MGKGSKWLCVSTLTTGLSEKKKYIVPLINMESYPSRWYPALLAPPTLPGSDAFRIPGRCNIFDADEVRGQPAKGITRQIHVQKYINAGNGWVVQHGVNTYKYKVPKRMQYDPLRLQEKVPPRGAIPRIIYSSGPEDPPLRPLPGSGDGTELPQPPPPEALPPPTPGVPMNEPGGPGLVPVREMVDAGVQVRPPMEGFGPPPPPMGVDRGMQTNELRVDSRGMQTDAQPQIPLDDLMMLAGINAPANSPNGVAMQQPPPPVLEVVTRGVQTSRGMGVDAATGMTPPISPMTEANTMSQGSSRRSSMSEARSMDEDQEPAIRESALHRAFRRFRGDPETPSTGSSASSPDGAMTQLGGMRFVNLHPNTVRHNAAMVQAGQPGLLQNLLAGGKRRVSEYTVTEPEDRMVRQQKRPRLNMAQQLGAQMRQNQIAAGGSASRQPGLPPAAVRQQITLPQNNALPAPPERLMIEAPPQAVRNRRRPRRISNTPIGGPTNTVIRRRRQENARKNQKTKNDTKYGRKK